MTLQQIAQTASIGSFIAAATTLVHQPWFALPFLNWRFGLPTAFLALGVLFAAAGFRIESVKRFFKKAPPEQPPFKQDEIIVNCEPSPFVIVNFENHICSFTVPIRIRNFTPYNVCIFSGECKTYIGGYGFINLEKSEIAALPSKGTVHYKFEKSLNEHEVKRALTFFSEGINEKKAQCEFQFSVTAPGGDKINIPSQEVCITMNKIGVATQKKKDAASVDGDIDA